jgi:YVTN family beta-propeller protein
VRLEKVEKKYHFFFLVIIVWIFINSWTMVPSYEAAAISTLDTLEFESNQSKEEAYFEVGKYPSAIAIDQVDDTVYVANSDSDTVSIIDGDTLEVRRVSVGNYPTSIAVDGIDHVAYVANYDSHTVSIIDGYTLDVAHVSVGLSPTSIAVNEGTGTVYVANYDSGTISVIDAIDFTNIANITVECCPRTIAVDEDDDRVYVGIASSPTVSVIDGSDFTNIANITVKCCPTDIVVDDDNIVVDDDNSTIYVTNYESEISAIDGETLEVAQVPVDCCITGMAVNEFANELYAVQQSNTSIYVINGTLNFSEFSIKSESFPLDIAVDDDDDIVYVTDYDRTVSVMDGISLEPQSRVSFNSDPFHAGHIECNSKTVPTNQYMYFDFGTPCKAQANKGFEFLSWEENLGGNSSQVIKVSQPASSLYSIFEFFGMPKPEEPEAALSTTESGTFTANFKELPPPIPPEYLATLFAVVVSAFIGSWLTPTFLGWRRMKKQGNKLDHYRKELKHMYKDGKLDNKDINSLDKLRDTITDEYARGKISKEQFDKLLDDISISYQEIFKREIDSVMIVSSDKDKEKGLNEIRDDIENACAKGKISELHYNLLNKRIESIVNTNKSQTSDNVKRSPV